MESVTHCPTTYTQKKAASGNVRGRIENAIRDLKYGVGLNHLPSGRFAANGAWLAVQGWPKLTPTLSSSSK